jgi:hypothetical protein
MSRETTWHPDEHMHPDDIGDLSVQNPRMVTPDGIVWMAHCCQCGTYTHNQASDPGVDYLCDDCQDA